MHYRRDLWTGELQEVPSDGHGRQIIFRCRPPFGEQTVQRRGASVWDSSRDNINIGMSVKPEEATQERITLLNENAKHCGTGAYYTPDGVCHTPTRRSAAKEMQARGNVDFTFQNNDAGYGDYAGR